MKTLLLFSILAVSLASAGETPVVDGKSSQILSTMVRHVLCDEKNSSARDFYGTKGDMTVILMDGAAQWPAGFVPKVEGFKFLLGQPQDTLFSDKHDRRLAIRLDRCDLGGPEKAKSEFGVLGENSPIQITIMNGGGQQNGAVIGGQSTWYSITKKDGKWRSDFVGLLD